MSMLMIYKNLFDFGVSSATNEDPNYPISNLDYSDFQGRTFLSVFKATGNMSEIELIPDEESIVSGFGIANHNIDTMTLELYDGLSSLLYSETYSYSDLVTPYNTVELINFDEINGVTKIKIIVQGLTDPLYIGSLMIGAVEETPSALFSENNAPISQTGNGSVTPEGAIYGSRGLRLEGHSFVFLSINQTEMDRLSAAADYSRLDRPFFLKRYVNDKLRVYWCRYTNTVLDQDMGEGPVYDTGFSVQEVR